MPDDTAPVICRGKGERRQADVCPINSRSRGPNFLCYVGTMQGKPGMIFTIEFFRIRLNDDAHATLDRLSVIVDDLDARFSRQSTTSDYDREKLQERLAKLAGGVALGC